MASGYNTSLAFRLGVYSLIGESRRQHGRADDGVGARMARAGDLRLDVERRVARTGD